MQSFGFDDDGSATVATGRLRLQQSGEQSFVTEAWDMEQSASMSAIPLGQKDLAVEELSSAQMTSANAGPVPRMAINMRTKILIVRFIPYLFRPL